MTDRAGTPLGRLAGAPATCGGGGAGPGGRGERGSPSSASGGTRRVLGPEGRLGGRFPAVPAPKPVNKAWCVFGVRGPPSRAVAGFITAAGLGGRHLRARAPSGFSRRRIRLCLQLEK